MHPELKCLLDAVSGDFAEKTAMLVAADWCQENGEGNLEKLLRWLAEPPHSTTYFRMLLATGSRIYGTPRGDSDWDWVFFCDYRDQKEIAALLGKKYRNGDLGICGVDLCLRFGPVNLLLVSTWSQYLAWAEGTELLVGEKPVTRDRAVEVFKRQRDGRRLLENGMISGTVGLDAVEDLVEGEFRPLS